MHLKDLAVGQQVDFSNVFASWRYVDVIGTTKDVGFQGVVKRQVLLGVEQVTVRVLVRIPGSIGFMRSQGRVIKGKNYLVTMGNVQRVMKKLEIIKIEPEAKVVFVKGSVPGSSGSLVFMQKYR